MHGFHGSAVGVEAEMSNEKMLFPANDWFFVSLPTEHQGVSVFRLAAWQHDDEGRVVGLVSVPGGGGGKQCRLLSVPPVRGIYKHKAELTDEEKASFSACKDGQGAWASW